MDGGSTLDFEHYTVAWIAPLEIEAQAARYMLDNVHSGSFHTNRGDDYVYTAGDINGHNVIIATFPAGHDYGISSAAALASQVKKSFPNLWFGLLVGVAAGLPNLSCVPPRDIRLGDVLVGVGEGQSAGLVNYDLGTETSDGFVPLHGGAQARTEKVVGSAIGKLKLSIPKDAFLTYYSGIKDKTHNNGTFVDPGEERDQLYETINEEGSLRIQVVDRPSRDALERTKVWYGSIGSGNKLMRNSQKRDELRDKFNLIGLEMEAAGIMNIIPVGVIRGVCDYGDAQKSKEWQPYAAAMAAAYAKALLYEITPEKDKRKDKMQAQKTELFTMERYPNFNEATLTQHFTGRHVLLSNIEEHFFPKDCSRRGRANVIVLHGPGGIGKTQIAIKFASEFKSRYNFIFKVNCSQKSTVQKSLEEMAIDILASPHATISKLIASLGASTRSWLLIFDGYDSVLPSASGYFQIDKYFPVALQGVNGHIIVTSKNEAASKLGHGIRVPTMSDPEAQELLLVTANLERSSVVPADLEEICKELDRYPLAIDVAGNYIRNQQSGIQEYCQRYRDMKAEFRRSLLRAETSLPTHSSYDQTLYSAWKLSFTAVAKIDASAANLLLLTSFINPLTVTSESAHIQSALIDRNRWSSTGTIQSSNGSNIGVPNWLCCLIGKRNLPVNGQPVLSSLDLSNAVNLISSYSLLRKGLFIVNDAETWGVHSVFRDCAIIFCDSGNDSDLSATGDLSAAAIALFLSSCPGIDKDCPLTQCNADDDLSDSWQLFEHHLVQTAFLPFTSLEGDSFDWTRILDTLEVSTISLPEHCSLDLLDPLDGLAFLSNLQELIQEGRILTSGEIRSCLCSAKKLRSEQFDGTIPSLLYLFYRIEYAASGRGLYSIYPNPQRLISPDILTQALSMFERPRFLQDNGCLRNNESVQDNHSIWFLNGLSLVLCAMNKLFVFNESNDNPSLFWYNSELQKVRQQWLRLRDSLFLHNYARASERFIARGCGCELLLRARARLFLEYGREMSDVLRKPFQEATDSNGMNYRYLEGRPNIILFLIIIALSDLQSMGIEHHLCAMGYSGYFAFGFCGFLVETAADGNIFRASARKKLDWRIAGASDCLERRGRKRISGALLKELVEGRISPRSWMIMDACRHCMIVWEQFNIRRRLEDQISVRLQSMVTRRHADFQRQVNTQLGILHKINNLLDKLDHVDTRYYSDRDDLELIKNKVKNGYKHALFTPILHGQNIMSPDAITAGPMHQMKGLLDMLSDGLSGLPELQGMFETWNPVDTSSLTSLRDEILQRLGIDEQERERLENSNAEKATSSTELSSDRDWFKRRQANVNTAVTALTQETSNYALPEPPMPTFGNLSNTTVRDRQLRSYYLHARDRKMKLAEKLWEIGKLTYLVNEQMTQLDLSVVHFVDILHDIGTSRD